MRKTYMMALYLSCGMMETNNTANSIKQYFHVEITIVYDIVQLNTLITQQSMLHSQK